MPEPFAQVAAAPYAFPFDARWSAADTAVLLLGFEDRVVDALGASSELAAAATLAHAARRAGIAVIGSRHASQDGARQAFPTKLGKVPCEAGRMGCGGQRPADAEPDENGPAALSQPSQERPAPHPAGSAGHLPQLRGEGSSRPSPQKGVVASVLGLVASDIVAHPGDNAFYGTDLEARLRAKAIRNLLIAGLPTDGLVHATMRNANDMGFECLVVSDACRGTSPERHEAQLRITTFGNGLFGTVAPLAAVLAALA